MGNPRAAAIAGLNDALRRTLTGGRVVMTAGVHTLSPDTRAAVLAAVRGPHAFDADNDPHGERDYGALTVAGVAVNWKIDCYDPGLRWHSSDPSDPAVTARVLTIMLAAEW